MERGGGTVTQRGERSGREQRGEQSAADGDGVMADRVDAAVDHAQPAGLDAVLDLPRGQPEAQQLPAGDRPALAARNAGDPLVCRTLTTTIGVNVHILRSRMPPIGSRARELAPTQPPFVLGSLAGMERLTVVGAPTSAGAYAPGQEDGPAALRAHGLLEALRAGGREVVDAGDVEGFRWRPDPERPRAANAPVVADRARQVAERAGAALAGGGRVLVLGGDCTVGVGTVAALAPAGGGLVYLDRHADLNTPATTIDGALDWMGVAHMLGADGAEPAIAGLAGPPPMLTADRVAYLALDLEIVAAAERERLDALQPAVVAMEQARADGAGAAAAALRALGDVPAVAVHFDVDVIDFLDAPLAENVDRTPGLPLDAAAEALAALLADPRVRAVTVTEFNPHHGEADGSTTRRLVEVLASAFAG